MPLSFLLFTTFFIIYLESIINVTVTFFYRYLRPTVDVQQQQQPARGESPPDATTTSSGGAEDECSTSAATSGEEVWGTPTSGGELDEELAFPTGETTVVTVRLKLLF